MRQHKNCTETQPKPVTMSKCLSAAFVLAFPTISSPLTALSGSIQHLSYTLTEPPESNMMDIGCDGALAPPKLLESPWQDVGDKPTTQ